MADEKAVTTHTVESHEEPKPKKRRARKPKKTAAAAVHESTEAGDDMEIVFEESEADHELGDRYVHHVGSTITLRGNVALRVMTPEQQKASGIKLIAGVMGRKCQKDPLVITFKNTKAAGAFFNDCYNDESADGGFIDDGPKVGWFSPTMTVMM